MIRTEEAAVAASVGKAARRYTKAIDEACGLSEQDLAEIRSYTNPHVLVRLVVMALCVLFEHPHEWHAALLLLGEQNPKLLDRIRDFDPKKISVLTAGKLHRICQEPEFNIVSVEQVRPPDAAGAWLRCCSKYE